MTEELKKDEESSPEQVQPQKEDSVPEITEPQKNPDGVTEGHFEAKEGDAAVKEEVKEDKGPALQPKSTASVAPTECAACSKALLKKMWYYRNGQFFCNKKCFKRKEEENAKKEETK